MVFGKEESGGGGFAFTFEVVESIVMQLNDFLSGALVAFFPLLPAHFIRPVLQLAISDVNKPFLVKCAAGLLKLLVEALFLDPLHVRAETACETKAAVQADAVTCCLQLACFEPGRALLERDMATQAALRALADDTSAAALTEQARVSANGVLMAIEKGGGGGAASSTNMGPPPKRSACAGARASVDGNPAAVGQHGHIFMSYQWDVQVTIQRVVRSLQARRYTCWFDLDWYAFIIVHRRHAALKQQQPHNPLFLPSPSLPHEWNRMDDY